MSLAVVGTTSLLKCSSGLTPSPLIVTPSRTVMAEGMLMGNITDMVPLLNIEVFGTCKSPTNPAVYAAAAAGDPAPPCTPTILMPWMSPAVTVLVQGVPVLDKSSCLTCTLGGFITVVETGNPTVMVP